MFKPNSEASVAVGGANFPMYTQNDGAWVKNAAEEAKMLDTMRKGADVVIKATDLARHPDHRHVLAQGHCPGGRSGVAGMQVGAGRLAILRIEPHLC